MNFSLSYVYSKTPLTAALLSQWELLVLKYSVRLKLLAHMWECKTFAAWHKLLVVCSPVCSDGTKNVWFLLTKTENENLCKITKFTRTWLNVLLAKHHSAVSEEGRLFSQAILTQDLTRPARTSPWEPKKGKTRNISFFGIVAIGSADLLFCLFKTWLML